MKHAKRGCFGSPFLFRMILNYKKVQELFCHVKNTPYIYIIETKQKHKAMKFSGHRSDAFESERDFDHVINDAIIETRKFIHDIEQLSMSEDERKKLLKAISNEIIERI